MTGGAIKTTETLKRDGGTAWQSAADLPRTGLRGIRGVSLYNGKFIVTGEGSS